MSLLTLPLELKYAILDFLDRRSLIAMAGTCHLYRKLVKDDKYWPKGYDGHIFRQQLKKTPLYILKHFNHDRKYGDSKIISISDNLDTVINRCFHEVINNEYIIFRSLFEYEFCNLNLDMQNVDDFIELYREEVADRANVKYPELKVRLDKNLKDYIRSKAGDGNFNLNNGDGEYYEEYSIETHYID